MDSITLTKDADKLVCEIYKLFLQKRKDGMSRSAAKRFVAPIDFDDALFKGWQNADFADTLAELKNNGFVKIFIGGDFDLLDLGIIYMENRFPNGLGQVLEVLTKLKNAIPLL